MSGRLFALVDFDKPYEEADYIQFSTESVGNVETSISSHQPNPNIILHKPQLDLDISNEYRHSSTPGHGHLQIDVEIPWEKYVQWLELSAELGIVQHGWVKASKKRGFTALRKPGVKKAGESDGYGKPLEVPY